MATLYSPEDERNKSGKTLVLINQTSYSNSTSRHQSRIRCAIPSWMQTIYGESDATAYPDRFAAAIMENARDYNRRLSDMRANHPRRKAQIATLAAKVYGAIESAARVKEAFGLSLNTSMEGVEELQRIMDAKEVANAEHRRIAAEKQAELVKNALPLWLAGENVPSYLLDGPAVFRLVAGSEGKQIESSKGVTLSSADALRAIHFLLALHDSGDWFTERARGYVIDRWLIDSVQPAGVVVGCHPIKWEEILRLKGLLEQ